MATMNFDVTGDAERTVITIRGHLTSLQSAMLCRKVEGLRDQGVGTVAVDLSAVNHIESAGLGGLIFCRHILEKAQIPFVLLGPSDHVRALLRTASFEDLFQIES